MAYAQKIQEVSFFEKGQIAPKLKTEFEKAVEADPTNLAARQALAQFYLNAPPIAGGSEAKAMEQIDAIRALDPRHGHVFMAELYSRKKDYAAAEQELKAALELDAKDTEVHYQLGMLYQAKEDYPAAFDAFEECVRMDAKHMGALYQIARTAIFAEDNYDRGIECLTVYLASETEPGQPTWAHAHWRLGMIYEKTGDKLNAMMEYGAALELDPGLQGAKEGLERLQ